MSVSLIEELKTIRDFRSRKGRRYELWLILLLIVMGVMSGFKGYAALEDFGVRHYPALCEALALTVKRLPSDTTFRRILERLNFQVLNAHFERWAMQYSDINPEDWMSLDGKSIKGTVLGGGTEYQNFVTLVSLYSQSQETVLATEQFETHQTNEIKAVQTLLERLHIKDVVFTLDAIHAQKKQPSKSSMAAMTM